MTETQRQQPWFYGAANAARGPMPFEQLQALATTGELQPTSLVWTQGMTDWAAAATIEGLLPERAPGTPPPLPPEDAGPPMFAQYAMQAPLGEQAGMRMLLPVGRSGWAIAAGYLGLFSVLVIFAPISLIVGIIAVRDLKKHPELHGAGRAWFGLLMGALFSIGFVFMVVALAMR